MDSIASTVLIVVLLLFIVGAAAPAIYAGWRRGMFDGRALELWQMMRRRGLSADADAAAGREHALALAARRCVMCPSTEECRTWLASGKQAGLEEFCPNASLLESLAEQKHRA
jgi:Family of unknown function (DUF6455)